jgi:hypothetical protein
MSFYQDIFYGDGFYGDGDVGDPATPVELAFYRTNTDNVYVFHWGFQEVYITPGIATIDFDLQIDTVTTFDSLNLQQFDSLSVLNYQNGNVRKGAAIQVALRQDGTEQTWYWRVRTKQGINFSDWSAPAQFTILEKFEVESAENILNNLPDYHVYGKSDLKRAVSARSSKLYKFSNMYGKEIDQTKLENILTITNNYVSLCRDEQLFDNFGIFFDYTKPQIQTSVEYRNTLRNLVLGSLTGGTFTAIRRIVKSFTGVTPILGTVKERNELFLSTILETPPEAPDGVRTFFSTSLEYTPGSLVVLLNGVAQDPGDDFTEDVFAPGFEMAVAPGALDVLTVCFDIGHRLDPVPVVLDLTDRTALTGSLTFTNGSRSVTGTGTAFLSEVQVGVVVTDSVGLSFGIVDEVTSDTSLTIRYPWVNATVTGPGFKLNYNSSVHIDGVIDFTNGSDQMVAQLGTGADFEGQLAVGSTVMDDYGDTAIIQSIEGPEAATLTANWTGATDSNQNARRLRYDDMPLWGRAALASGLIIRVLNPGEFDLPRTLLETLVKLLLPAHVLVFFEYEV